MTSGQLKGKRILITGATDGIGLAAARALSGRGATVAIVGRNAEKTSRVAKEIGAESFLCDFSELASIRALAGAVKSRFDSLDVLVNNAGAIFFDHGKTVDGFERTFAVNHLGYFALTSLLLDTLKRSPAARIVSTASSAHLRSRLSVATLPELAKGRDRAAGFSAYADSKLCNILFTHELAKRFAGTPHTANVFHPGFVGTSFAKNNGPLFRAAAAVVYPIMTRRPEKGAETLVWLASSAEAQGLNGAYLRDRKPTLMSSRAKDGALAAELWTLSERLVHATDVTARARGPLRAAP